jgi:hypothetical protein
MSHLVIGSAQLETKYRLLIFSLEEDLALESVAEVDSRNQGDLVAHFAYPWEGRDDEAQVLSQENKCQSIEAAMISRTQRLTSGCPLGSRNSSGTRLFFFCRFSSDGGDGCALYSVRDRPLKLGFLLGVCGRYPLLSTTPLVPFTAAPFTKESIVLSTCEEERKRGERWSESFDRYAAREILAGHSWSIDLLSAARLMMFTANRRTTAGRHVALWLHIMWLM